MTIFTKNGRCHCFGRMTNETSSKPLKTTTATKQQRPTHEGRQRQHGRCHNYSLSVPGELFCLFFPSKILTSYDLLCCSVGARVELRGREHVNANVCGVADQAGGGTVSAGIFVCFYIALKILTCYYQCRERRPWGRAGRAARGKGTW